MKICPQCNKTYDDDNLNFCLDDGSVLSQGGGSTQNNFGETIRMNKGDSGQNDLPATMMINQPPTTTPHQSQNPGFNQPFGGGQQNQSNWGGSPQSVQPAQKGSKTWLWVVGIFGVLIVVCGGGLIGFFALVSNIDDNKNWNSNSGNNKNISINSRSGEGSPTPDDRKSISKIDLSAWVKTYTADADLEYQSGELLMNVKLVGYYYAMLAGSIYKTENATTKLTVRNTESVSSDLGYGLIFHSDPKPFKQGYAFLIDTDKQRYRIVRHVPDNEYVVVNWTDDSSIKSGSQENVIEVRDEGSDMKFYINDSLVTTKPNAFGARGGVAGLYVGTNTPIAFSGFEIKK